MELIRQGIGALGLHPNLDTGRLLHTPAVTGDSATQAMARKLGYAQTLQGIVQALHGSHHIGEHAGKQRMFKSACGHFETQLE